MPTASRITSSSPNNNRNNNNNNNNGSSSSQITQRRNPSRSVDSYDVIATPTMRHVSKRLATFTSSPPEVKEQRKLLAAAGFFYTGRSDVVECAFCSGKLHKGKISGQPMEDHARFFGGCPFVKRASSSGTSTESRIGGGDKMGGASDHGAVIVNEKDDSLVLLQYITHLRKENDAMRQVMTCVVCETAPVHTLLLPCRHLVCCDKCGLAAKSCPKCSGKIKERIPTYMV